MFTMVADGSKKGYRLRPHLPGDRKSPGEKPGLSPLRYSAGNITNEKARLFRPG
jgi:hypothetical protein